MSSFSQIVDEMVLETKRPDLRTEIIAYVNQVIRELHFEPQRGNVVLYRNNMRELQLTATVEEGFTWDIPSPAIFQGLTAVQYQSVSTRLGKDVWPPEIVPGRMMGELTRYFYRVGGTYVFAGYGGIGALINLAYFEYPPRLIYYVVDARPATWDDSIGAWTYSAAYESTPELKAEAEALSANWILLRWHDVVTEGVRAKVYKRLSDTERARTSYSMYSTLRQGVVTSEAIATNE